MANLNERQRRFVDEYMLDPNATQSAINAGYSPRTARSQGQRLLTNADIRAEIKGRTDARRWKKIANADEILEQLSSIARGQATEEVFLAGERLQKPPAIRDRIRAMELLGKRLGLFGLPDNTDQIESLTERIQVMPEEELERLQEAIAQRFRFNQIREELKGLSREEVRERARVLRSELSASPPPTTPGIRIPPVRRLASKQQAI